MYGEASGILRDALGVLLRQHRIQQRIGGAGLHTVPETTTLDERKAIGEQIARYRYAVLVWGHQAMRAANPRINLKGSPAAPAALPKNCAIASKAPSAASRSTCPRWTNSSPSSRSPSLIPGAKQLAPACSVSTTSPTESATDDSQKPSA